MKTDIGEYVVGAYLKIIEDCDVVDYNVRVPGGGLEGLGELDVIGINFKKDTVHVCEVTTHIRGLVYKDNVETVRRLVNKHQRQKEYAKKYLNDFNNHYFYFWSPVVPVGYITQELGKIKTLQLVINGEYKKRIEMMRQKAKTMTHDTNNPFFRVLQILEHMRDT